MKFPGNVPYRRRYTSPDRPSNRLPDGFYDRATRERVQEIAHWLDGQAVIAEAVAILRGPGG